MLSVLIWALESLFEYLYAVRWRNLAQDLQHVLRQNSYQHLQRLPPDTIETARSGRLMAVLNEDINQIERFLNTGANELIRSEEHTSELQSLMRISYAVFCLKQ